MSIAVAISVHDGIVLAADSASTLAAALPVPAAMGSQQAVLTVWNNANKIANLLKGKSIGCVAYGSGSIGSASISTLLKDFRLRLREGLEDFNPDAYTMQEVTQRLSNFLGERVAALGPNDPRPSLGMMLGGYSADKTTGEGENLGEVWSIA